MQNALLEAGIADAGGVKVLSSATVPLVKLTDKSTDIKVGFASPYNQSCWDNRLVYLGTTKIFTFGGNWIEHVIAIHFRLIFLSIRRIAWRRASWSRVSVRNSLTFPSSCSCWSNTFKWEDWTRSSPEVSTLEEVVHALNIFLLLEKKSKNNLLDFYCFNFRTLIIQCYTSRCVILSTSFAAKWSSF